MRLGWDTNEGWVNLNGVEVEAGKVIRAIINRRCVFSASIQ